MTSRKEELKKEIEGCITRGVDHICKSCRLIRAEIKGIEETEKEFADWLDNKSITLSSRCAFCMDNFQIIEKKIKELRGGK